MVAYRTTITLISPLDTISIYHININTPFIQMHVPVPTQPTWARPCAHIINIIIVIMSHRMCRDRRQFLQRPPYVVARAHVPAPGAVHRFVLHLQRAPSNHGLCVNINMYVYACHNVNDIYFL